MKLELNSISVECIIGELPDERQRLQPLQVDVELEIPDDAATSDELFDTVDYAALSEKIRAALIAAECRMIERAAKIAADVCLAERKVSSAKAKVTKFGAVKGLKSASATFALSGVKEGL